MEHSSSGRTSPTRRTRGRGSTTRPTTVGHSHWATLRYTYNHMCTGDSHDGHLPPLRRPRLGHRSKHKTGPTIGRLTPAYTEIITADRPVNDQRGRKSDNRQASTQPERRQGSHPKGHIRATEPGTPPQPQTTQGSHTRDTSKRRTQTGQFARATGSIARANEATWPPTREGPVGGSSTTETMGAH